MILVVREAGERAGLEAFVDLLFRHFLLLELEQILVLVVQSVVVLRLSLLPVQIQLLRHFVLASFVSLNYAGEVCWLGSLHYIVVLVDEE